MGYKVEHKNFQSVSFVLRQNLGYKLPLKISRSMEAKYGNGKRYLDTGNRILL